MLQKILVVDDDESIRLFLDESLKKNGYKVITAANGEETLRLINTDSPALMIVDLSMPVINGWYFTMKVRMDPRYMNKPIIILSGLLEREGKPDTFEAGTFHMPKPF